MGRKSEFFWVKTWKQIEVLCEDKMPNELFIDIYIYITYYCELIGWVTDMKYQSALSPLLVGQGYYVSLEAPRKNLLKNYVLNFAGNDWNGRIERCISRMCSYAFMNLMGLNDSQPQKVQ